MARSVIDEEKGCVTVINVFTVEPERAHELVSVLAKATDDVFSKLPGFISANFHISIDRTRVTNYAQWESEEQLDYAMRVHPGGIAEREAVQPIKISSAGAVYRVASVHRAASAAGHQLS